jgi:hypothetical protein
MSDTQRSLHPAGLAVLALCLIAPPLGAAQDHTAPPPVHVIRVEGAVRAPLPTDAGTTDLWLQHRGKTYRLQSTGVRIVSGPGTSADILSHVAGFRPSFVLSGSDAMIGRLDTAKPSEVVDITGYFRSDTRTLLVTDVAIRPAATTAPGPTPTG